MSDRQKRVSLTKKEQEYVKSHRNESIASISRHLGISTAKLSINLKLMGMNRNKPQRKPMWERNGFFDEDKFAKLPIP